MPSEPWVNMHWKKTAYPAAKNRERLYPIGVAMVIFALAFFSPTPAHAQENSQAEVERIRTLIRNYERSISDADTKLASEVWSATDDISFIHPLGHEHGWEEIKRNIYEKLMRDVFSERKLTTSDISIHTYKDAAWAEFNWVFVAKLRSNGSAVRTEGRETQVYHKTARGWRLVHIHYSGMTVPSRVEGS